jgi:hypothetical protein
MSRDVRTDAAIAFARAVGTSPARVRTKSGAFTPWRSRLKAWLVAD